MKRRLVLLVHLPPPIHGVTTVNTQVISSAHLRRSFDVDVIPLQFADDVASIGPLSPRKLARALRIAVRLTRLFRERRPDALYLSVSPHGGAFLRDCVYIAIAKALGVPRILHLHATEVRAPQALHEWAFEDALGIYLSPRISRAPGLAASVDVPNGVADLATRAEPDHRGPPRILFLSNMLRAKGPLVLVEALASLKQRGHVFTACFAGAEGDCGAQVRAAISQHRLDPIVRYVGPVDEQAKLELLRNSSIFVHPTLADAFPLVVLEAMRSGLPVVASDEGGVADMVEDGVTGVLVPPGDAEELAEQLSRLLADPARCRRMGAAGRQRYEASFTVEHFEQRLVAAISTFLDQSLPPV